MSKKTKNGFIDMEYIVIRKNITETLELLSGQQTSWKYFTKNWNIYFNNSLTDSSEYCSIGDFIGSFNTFSQFCNIWSTFYDNIDTLKNSQIQILTQENKHCFDSNSEGGKFTVFIEKKHSYSLFQLLIDGIICKTLPHSYLIDGITLSFFQKQIIISIWTNFLEKNEKEDIFNEFNYLIKKTGSDEHCHYYSHSAELFKPSTTVIQNYIDTFQDSVESKSLIDILNIPITNGWGKEWETMTIKIGDKLDFLNKFNEIKKLLQFSGIVSLKTKHKDLGKKESIHKTVIMKIADPTKKNKRFSNLTPFKINASPFIPKSRRKKDNKEDSSLECVSEILTIPDDISEDVVMPLSEDIDISSDSVTPINLPDNETNNQEISEDDGMIEVRTRKNKRKKRNNQKNFKRVNLGITETVEVEPHIKIDEKETIEEKEKTRKRWKSSASVVSKKRYSKSVNERKGDSHEEVDSDNKKSRIDRVKKKKKQTYQAPEENKYEGRGICFVLLLLFSAVIFLVFFVILYFNQKDTDEE